MRLKMMFLGVASVMMALATPASAGCLTWESEYKARAGLGVLVFRLRNYCGHGVAWEMCVKTEDNLVTRYFEGSTAEGDVSVIEVQKRGGAGHNMSYNWNRYDRSVKKPSC